MPRVPTYDQFQVAPTVGPTQRVEAGISTEGAALPGREIQRMGDAMLSAGGDAGRIALDMQNDANATRVNDAMNQLVQARIDAQAQALTLKGKDALERPDGQSLADEFTQKLEQSAQGITQGLSNDAQRRSFQMQSGQIFNQLRGQLTTHMIEQQKVYADQTAKATIDTAVNQATLLWGDPAMRAQSTAAITGAVDSMAKRNGWDDKVREAALIAELTPMHAGIIKGMIQGGRSDQAQAYYDEHSAGMSLQARATVHDAIQQAAEVQLAEGKVSGVWQQLGPKGANDPVKLYDMEQQLREEMRNDRPEALTKALASLKQRAVAFNAQQAEVNAANTNSVFGLLDKGTPLAQVQVSDAWLALPESKRHDIVKALEAEEAARESRLAARANRRASESARELTELQRTERLNFLRNGDKYLTVSDPEVLSKMTRGQVEALRVDFGMEPTQHLLNRWDTLQKPGKVAEARIDKQDFDQVADQMGLRPYDPTKNENERRALGSLQYRVEQLIDMEQTRRKASLTREEKVDLMRKEMAITVEVDAWGRNPQVPVINLTPEQAAKVVIPAADRATISQKMAQRFQETGGDARFAPTEANLRFWYLSSKSSAAQLIPPAK